MGRLFGYGSYGSKKLHFKGVRSKLFGDNYDSFNPSFLNELAIEPTKQNKSKLDAILAASPQKNDKDYKDTDDEENKEEIGGQKAIIDFPNFLLHIIKIKYNDIYVDRKKTLVQSAEEEDLSVPLNEKELLNVYRIIAPDVKPMEFVTALLFYRVLFDRYIVKAIDNSSNDYSSNEEADAEEFKWTLHKPTKRIDRRRNYEYIGFEDTFKGDIQDKVIKALSMLQVTYRQRRYKNYLTDIFSSFEYGKVDYDGRWFLDKLNRLMLNEFETNQAYEPLRKGFDFTHENSLALGTHTPHFLFNFIDYLYWTAWKGHRDNYFSELKYLTKDFTFRYFNSVEHHLPQSFSLSVDNSVKYIHSLGNLCLVSKSMNSRLNNESPIGKAAKESGKYYREDLPPTRKIIYDITNDNRRWEQKEIEEHYNNIVALIKDRASILGINKIDPDDIDVVRALLCNVDLRDNWVMCTKGWRTTLCINLNDPRQSNAFSDLTDWGSSHPLLTLEDYIQEQVANNASLKGTPWRYYLVKYPEILRRCENRRVAFDENDNMVTLIERKKVANNSLDLWIQVVLIELKRKDDSLLVSGNNNGGFIKLPQDHMLELKHDGKHNWSCGITGSTLETIPISQKADVYYEISSVVDYLWNKYQTINGGCDVLLEEDGISG